MMADVKKKSDRGWAPSQRPRILAAASGSSPTHILSQRCPSEKCSFWATGIWSFSRKSGSLDLDRYLVKTIIRQMSDKNKRYFGRFADCYGISTAICETPEILYISFEVPSTPGYDSGPINASNDI